VGLVRLCLVLVVAFGAARPAMSEDVARGNGFYVLCSDAVGPTANQGRIVCLAYVKGLYDMAGYLQPASKAGLVCSPEGVTMDQYLDILVKYLRDNPERRQALTAELMWEAASKAYPCSRRP
jgi:hypothetical protein